MNLPKVLFYVVVERDGEVIHARTFTHEGIAKEWGEGFAEKFTVTMGRYAPQAWTCPRPPAKPPRKMKP